MKKKQINKTIVWVQSIRFLPLVFLLFCTLPSQAQKNKIDSLRAVLIQLNSSSSEFNPTIAETGKSNESDTVRIDALNRLAWELMNRDPDTCTILYKQALNLTLNYFPESKENSSLWSIRQKFLAKVYSNIGVFRKLRGDLDSSLYFSFKALEIRKVLNDLKGISVSYGNIAGTYHKLGAYPKALDYSLKALEVAEKINDTNGIALYLCSVGVLLEKQKEHSKALDYYFSSLKITEATGEKSVTASTYLNIGAVYIAQKNYQQALDFFFKGLALMKELENTNGIGSMYGNIGAVYALRGKEAMTKSNFVESDSLFDKASDYYFKTLEIAELLGDKVSVARQFNNIGDLYAVRKNYKKAEIYLQKALALSTTIGALKLVSSNHHNLSELYEEMKQPAKALYHFKKYIIVKDSLFNDNNTKKMVQSEMNFEFEKKQAVAKAEQEKQNLIAAQEKQKQKIILILVTCFLIFVLVFASFMYKRWRITQKQKVIIEKQKQKIIDSITYAQLIQQSILPEEEEIKRILPDSFIYFQPKDIVSGDFYWFSKVVESRKPEAGSNKTSTNSGLRTSDFQLKTNSGLPTSDFELLIIAAVDCTGHGVPGAFMSMIGNTLLNQIVNEKQITVPSEILQMLNTGVSESLHQKNDNGLSKDGMDIALCSIDFKNNQLQYSGAHNPLIYIVDNEINVIKASKNGIGGAIHHKSKVQEIKEYANHTIAIKKGMTIYLFTDGYEDQFGGPDRKKFGTKQFQELLMNNQHLDMQQQKELLQQTHKNWKGSNQQIDDILVIGIRL